VCEGERQLKHRPARSLGTGRRGGRAARRRRRRAPRDSAFCHPSGPGADTPARPCPERDRWRSVIFGARGGEEGFAGDGSSTAAAPSSGQPTNAAEGAAGAELEVEITTSRYEGSEPPEQEEGGLSVFQRSHLERPRDTEQAAEEDKEGVEPDVFIGEDGEVAAGSGVGTGGGLGWGDETSRGAGETEAI